MAGSLKSVDHSLKFDYADGLDSETETETTKLTFNELKKSLQNSESSLTDSLESGSSFQNTGSVKYPIQRLQSKEVS